VTKRCSNCEVELNNYDGELCPACLYLSRYGTYENRTSARRAREAKLTNRRWQMRFNRGQLIILALLAWYFAIGREVFGPFDTRSRCEHTAGIVQCYCVLMFPTDCNDLYG